MPSRKGAIMSDPNINMQNEGQTPEFQPANGDAAQPAQPAQSQMPQVPEVPQAQQAPDMPQTPVYGAAPETPATPQYGQEYGRGGQSVPQYAAPAATPQYGQSAGQPTYGQPADQNPYAQPISQPVYGQTADQNPYAQPAGQPVYGQGTDQNPYTQPASQPAYGQAANQPPYTQPAQGMPQYGQPAYGQPAYGQPAPGAGQPLPQGVPAYAGAQFPGGTPTLDQPWYGIGFVEAVKRFFQKYATFSGRASRGEFWWVILFFALVNIALAIVFSPLPSTITTIIGVVWELATIVPFVAVAVRRLHDTNKSGWWVLLPGIPYAIVTVWEAIWEPMATSTLTGISMNLNPNDPAQVEMLAREFGNMMTPLAGMGLLGLVYLISGIVLMVGRTNPAGARFDAQR